MRLGLVTALTGGENQQGLLAWLKGDDLGGRWDSLLSPGLETSATSNGTCREAARIRRALDELSPVEAARFQEDALKTLHYPFFVASVIQVRGDSAGAAEILWLWMRREEALRFRAPVGAALESFYGNVARIFFLNGSEGPFFDEEVARHELIEAHREALVGLEEVFRLMRNSDLRGVDLPNALFLPSSSPSYASDNVCHADRFVDTAFGSGNRQAREAFEYLMTSYRENTNNIAYRLASSGAEGDPAMQNLRMAHERKLERLDRDCIPAGQEARDFPHYSDTVVALTLMEVQDLAWDAPAMARSRLCRLKGLAEPMRMALIDYKASTNAAEPHGLGEEAAIYPAHLFAQAWQRDEVDLVAQIERDLLAMQRIFGAFAGDERLTLEDAQEEVCKG